MAQGGQEGARGSEGASLGGGGDRVIDLPAGEGRQPHQCLVWRATNALVKDNLLAVDKLKNGKTRRTEMKENYYGRTTAGGKRMLMMEIQLKTKKVVMKTTRRRRRRTR